jgi:glycosidase
MMGHENRGGDDEVWRQTMPGGFPNDSRSVFTKEGRTQKENEIHEYTKKLIHWRNSSPAIHEGKLVHFIPQDNVYVYFRVHKDQTVMVVMNNSEENRTLERVRFAEILDKFKSGQNVMNNRTIDLSDDFSVDAKSTIILELK